MSGLSEWPQWMSQLLWTGATVGVAYLVGHVIKVVAGPYFVRLAARTSGDWDDVLISEVKRRIPFWSFLIGIYLALPRWWPHGTEPHLTVVRVLSALGIASFTFAAAAVATRLVVSFAPRTGPGVHVSALTQNIVRTVVTLLGVLVIFRAFDYDITPYLTALGVGGLAVALAVQDPLSNFFAGVFMTVAGQIRIGDYVKLDSGVEGYVQDFNWRATSIRMLSGNVAIVPNNKLSQAAVTNYQTRNFGMAVELGVAYDTDLDKAERVAVEVAQGVMAEVPGGVRNAETSVRFLAFGASAITMSVNMRSQEFVDQFLVKHEFIKRLHARFEKEGIVIPYPTTTLHARTPVPVNMISRTE